MLSPFDLSRVVHCPGRRVHLLLLRLVNRPGALSEALSILAKHKLNIVSLTTSLYKYRSEDMSENIIYVDFTDSAATLPELQAELKGCRAVVDVKIIEQQFPSITIDELHFPVRMLDWRAIILRRPVYEALFKGIREKFGSAGEVFLYYMGIEVGKGLFKDVERLGIEKTATPRFFKLLELIHGRSLIDIRELDTDAKRVTIRVHDSFECTLAEKQDKPYSQFYRGLLTGLFSGLIDSDLSAETKCVAIGDPYCEFQIEKLQEVPKRKP